MMQLPERVEGLHHITVATGSAQGDVDLLVKTLGQRLVKKTMFYDGARPVYHLRSEEHTSELQSLMRISYAVFCLNKNNKLLSASKQIYKHIYYMKTYYLASVTSN